METVEERHSANHAHPARGFPLHGVIFLGQMPHDVCFKHRLFCIQDLGTFFRPAREFVITIPRGLLIHSRLPWTRWEIATQQTTYTLCEASLCIVLFILE